MREAGLIIIAVFFLLSGTSAQEASSDNSLMNDGKSMQYYRSPGYEGLNVFETSKETDVKFDGMEVRVGGDFALQFQGLDHSNADGAPELIPLGSNLNLPTANLNLDVQLHEGVRMHLRTYLSSRHHNESWVKGG